MHRLILLLSAVLGLGCNPAGIQAQPQLDVVIRNGRVLDGSGNPWLPHGRRPPRGPDRCRRAARPTPARRVIDATGRLVTPGFIDVHSHAAEGLVRQALRQGQPLLAQGVTTIVANPDGGGPVDLARQRAALETGWSRPERRVADRARHAFGRR